VFTPGFQAWAQETGEATTAVVEANTTYRCGCCGQLLPFDARRRVPDACLRRCRSGCDWHPVGPTTAEVYEAASVDGPVGEDGLPAGPRR